MPFVFALVLGGYYFCICCAFVEIVMVIQQSLCS